MMLTPFTLHGFGSAHNAIAVKHFTTFSTNTVITIMLITVK